MGNGEGFGRARDATDYGCGTFLYTCAFCRGQNIQGHE